MFDNAKKAAVITLIEDQSVTLKDIAPGYLFAFDDVSIVYVMLENPIPHVTGVWCRCQPLGIGSPEVHSGDVLVVSFDSRFD